MKPIKDKFCFSVEAIMDNRLENMLRDGFTKKFASYYLDLLDKENSSDLYSKNLVEDSHSKGFLAECMSVYNFKDNDITDYLSDSDYYKVWSLNGWTRVWINDKLTLKYMLANSEFSNVMPEYYYYSTNEGLRALIDNPNKDQTFEGFCELLKIKKVFACKPCNGTASEGFYKIEFDGENYLINNSVCSKEELNHFILTHPNYVFTEYLCPEKSMAKINSQIHTLRLVTLNKDGVNPIIAGGYLRFGLDGSGAVNYIHTDDNGKDSFNLFSEVDISVGTFGNTLAVYSDHIEKIDFHPDSKEKLMGNIPFWSEITNTVISICKRFFGVEWMGFDIGITDDGIKIMEINSHPGIKYMQIFKPMLKDPILKDYFEEKLKKIDEIDENSKRIRNNILR